VVVTCEKFILVGLCGAICSVGRQVSILQVCCKSDALMLIISTLL